MCQCPDGSDAGFAGCAGSSQPRPPQGNYCPSSGGTCPYGTSCCGTQCCNQGSKCSVAGSCIPEQANDCGNGNWCNSGTQCWRAPANIGSIREGEFKCVTPSQAADLQRALMEQLAAERQRKLAEEEEKRSRDEQRRIAAKMTELQKQEGAARRQLEQAASAQKQASQQFLQAAEQQRLQRAQKLNADRARGATQVPESCTLKQIQAIANGADPNKACSSIGTPAVQPLPTNSPTPQEKASANQLDYLRRNAVRMQPDERKVALPASPPSNPPNLAVCSTFTGGRCPTAEEAAAAEAQRAEDERRAAAQRAQDEARKNEELRKDWERRQAEEAAQAKKREEEAARTAPYTETEPFEDCGVLPQSLEIGRQALCESKGGGIYCTRGTHSRTCTPAYVMGLRGTPKCDDWKPNGLSVPFCKTGTSK